jgi:transposase
LAVKHSNIATFTRNTIGVDVSDRKSYFYILNAQGEYSASGSIPTSPQGFLEYFGSLEPARVAIETGTHSLWLTWLIQKLGHEVLLANARELKLIFNSTKKDDPMDAEKLCRLARFDPKLLHPVEPRSKERQIDRLVLASRSQLVKARTQLVLHVRGEVKTFGARIPSSYSTEAFHYKAAEHVPEEIAATIQPMLDTIKDLTQRIRAFDVRIEGEMVKKYPETKLLRQVPGVGPITALAFVLAIGDPHRFKDSRQVGTYFGLTPRLDKSGKIDRQCGISKAGDDTVRTLLVSSAHYVLGPFGPDSDLRRFGQELGQQGGKGGKKRAVIAVARKLAVLLHALWVSGEPHRASVKGIT